ncbi:ParB/RepB/Spo0J family partition protein [Pseudoroseicyclus tamaricis]|uniref:ParB/RepB/Spo0J family partition protein n=1 Tax=Pseudoroseicyclus tamaricis TaxID=2705421 RepID=A0A6B2K4K2_9RHOB|nr:ParB/RepB/Spo0J family partition protein [Pseudoroseicyclus tamaricis]NDV02772.1 ParB/RepB/Spo0J family partition protein [Pseudoroseicyclus tamaricis]
MAEKPKTRGLGRGLSALMADVTPAGEEPKARRPDTHLPIEQIRPNPDQPRRHFDEAELKELAESVARRGIIQPLIVRPDPSHPGDFQIVAGERRWRAAQIARLHELPVLVRDYSETEVLEIAIIENIQRADLNPVDEAAGYRALMDRFGHTQEQMATALGKSRPYIANLLRLLSLPEDVQGHLADGTLSAGHARALVGHPEASALARRVLQGGLSVRATERLVKQGTTPPKPREMRAPEKDADTKAIETELAAQLKMGVNISHKPGTEGGTLTLHYRTLDQLDDLLRALGGD